MSKAGIMDDMLSSFSSRPRQTPGVDAPVYIFFEMEINWTTFRALQTRLVQLIDRGTTEINLVMSSGGGSCGAAVTCFNFLKSLNIKLRTYNTGDVNSASILMFMAGAERYSVSSGRFLFHPLSYETNGSFTIAEYQDIIKNMKTDICRIAEIYNSVLGIPMEQAEDMLDREHWVDAYGAKELGLIHQIAPLQITSGSTVEILPLP